MDNLGDDYKRNVIENLRTELKLKGFSEKTVQNYAWFVGKFLEHSKKRAEDLNEDDCKRYIASIIDEKSRNTVSLASSVIKFFYSEILNKPLLKFKMPKKEGKLPEVLTKDEIKMLINAAETEKSRIMMLFLYSSGLRVSELVNLKVSDMDLKEKCGWVRKGKGGKDRLFFLSDFLMKPMQDYLGKNPENKFLFSCEKPLTTRNIQKIIKAASIKAGIKKNVHPHSLRHSYATHLLDAGVDIRRIQSLLGHKNIHTTEIYTHVTTEELKKIKNPLDSLYGQS